MIPEPESLINKCIELCVAQNRASTPMLQKAFKIGWVRASRIIDHMEAIGIVGPIRPGKINGRFLPREILTPRVKNCSTCKFWVHLKVTPVGGECRHRSPVCAPNTGGSPAWPITVDGDFCGDHVYGPIAQKMDPISPDTHTSLR